MERNQFKPQKAATGIATKITLGIKIKKKLRKKKKKKKRMISKALVRLKRNLDLERNKYSLSL